MLAILWSLPAIAQAQHAGHAQQEAVPARVEAPASTAAQARDRHGDHADHPRQQGDAGVPQDGPHAGHAAPAASSGEGDPSAAPSQTQLHSAHSPSPAALPSPTAAELAAAFPDLHGMRMQDHMDDDPVLATLMFDRLEHRQADGVGNAAAWELQGWVGDLQNRLWLRSEGEHRGGRVEHGDIELLWGRPTGPWWDVLFGVRHDLGDGPSREWLAVGMRGLAPYKFELAATAYLGTGGRAALRVEAEYDVLLTNRLVLQPRAEANLHARDDPARDIGRGLSDASLGLRLRYEVTGRFAPYVGYEWARSFGRTADFTQVEGDARSDTRWVAGVRFWF